MSNRELFQLAGLDAASVVIALLLCAALVGDAGGPLAVVAGGVVWLCVRLGLALVLPVGEFDDEGD